MVSIPGEPQTLRFLIIPLHCGVGLGPLTRLLTIAECARNNGHEVTFIARAEFAVIIRKAGFNTFIAPRSVSHPDDNSILCFNTVDDDAANYGWADPTFLKECVKQEIQLIQELNIDMMCTEYQLSVPISSHISGVPFMSTTSWPDHVKFTSSLFSTSPNVYTEHVNAVNLMIASFGMPPITRLCELIFHRAHLKICCSLPELQEELVKSEGNTVHYVGHLNNNTFEQDEQQMDLSWVIPGNHLIYVYLTPGIISQSVWLPTLIEAFRATPSVSILAVVNDHFLPMNLPAHIRLFTYVPAMSVIPHATMVITHGGANTVHAALACGKPLLIHHGNYAERHYNGIGVERFGAGLSRPPDYMTPTQLFQDCFAILYQPKYTECAQNLAGKLAERQGAQAVIYAIERFADSKIDGVRHSNYPSTGTDC
ncbi:hypothetical protein I4U23_004416 [Adineta vaga]|nr:hypothetical protein I4U23_004416 [Adineta vaga]